MPRRKQVQVTCISAMYISGSIVDFQWSGTEIAPQDPRCWRGIPQTDIKIISTWAPQAVNQPRPNNSLKYCTHLTIGLAGLKAARIIWKTRPATTNLQYIHKCTICTRLAWASFMQPFLVYIPAICRYEWQILSCPQSMEYTWWQTMATWYSGPVVLPF